MILDNINSLLYDYVIVTEKLPFNFSDLEPYISEKTIQEHYNYHYKIYLRKLFKLIKGTKYEKLDILDVVNLSKKENKYDIFNNSAQVANHEFYFKSLKLGTKNELLKNKLLPDFLDHGSSLFGSGWVWFVQERQNKDILIINTSNAERPSENKYKLLAVCDIWEHAYYLDYKSKRNQYLKNFINYLINWDFIEHNLSIE